MSLKSRCHGVNVYASYDCDSSGTKPIINYRCSYCHKLTETLTEQEYHELFMFNKPKPTEPKGKEGENGKAI